MSDHPLLKGANKETNMKYKIELEATVEAENADTAEEMVFGALVGCADDIEAKAVPAQKWIVGVDLSTVYRLSVVVNADSAEHAEEEASKLVEDVASIDGISGVLEMADTDDYELMDVCVDVQDADLIEGEEECTEIGASVTGTENSAA